MLNLTAGSAHRGVANGVECWIAQASYTDDDGRRRFIRGYGATEREAIKRRQTNIAKRLAAPTRVSPNVRQLFERWMASYGPNDLTPETRRKYSRDIELHILPHIATVQLVNLDRERLERLVNHDLAKLAAGARNNAYKTMNVMFGWAVKNSLLPLNPLHTINAPKYTPAVHDDDDKWIKRRTDVAMQLLDWLEKPDCPYHADYARVLFSFLGLRRSELLGMTWDTVTNITKKGHANLRVKQQLRWFKGEGWHIEPRTKNNKIRTIPLPERWRLALRDESARQSDLRSPHE